MASARMPRRRPPGPAPPPTLTQGPPKRAIFPFLQPRQHCAQYRHNSQCAYTPRHMLPQHRIRLLRVNVGHGVIGTNEPTRQRNHTVVHVSIVNVAQPAHLVEHRREDEIHAAHGDHFANDVQILAARRPAKSTECTRTFSRDMAGRLSPQGRATTFRCARGTRSTSAQARASRSARAASVL